MSNVIKANQNQLSPAAKALVHCVEHLIVVAIALPGVALESIGFATIQLLQWGAGQMSAIDPNPQASPDTVRVHRAFCEANAAFQRAMTSDVVIAPVGIMDRLNGRKS